MIIWRNWWRRILEA